MQHSLTIEGGTATFSITMPADVAITDTVQSLITQLVNLAMGNEMDYTSIFDKVENLTERVVSVEQDMNSIVGALSGDYDDEEGPTLDERVGSVESDLDAIGARHRGRDLAERELAKGLASLELEEPDELEIEPSPKAVGDYSTTQLPSEPVRRARIFYETADRPITNPYTKDHPGYLEFDAEIARLYSVEEG